MQTHIPVTILDNFFENPDVVREFALEQEYFLPDDSSWPGARTKPLSSINKEFFDMFCHRVLSLFYEGDVHRYFAHLAFQKIPKGFGTGWIHTDNSLITTMVYLNKNSALSTGTSIYRPKKHVLLPKTKYNDIKCELHAGKRTLAEAEEFKNINDEQFEETIKISNVYNRLVMFDSTAWHGAQDLDSEENRLTLIGFFKDLPPISPVRRCSQFW